MTRIGKVYGKFDKKFWQLAMLLKRLIFRYLTFYSLYFFRTFQFLKLNY